MVGQARQKFIGKKNTGRDEGDMGRFEPIQAATREEIH